MDLIFLKSLRPLYCDYISRILCVRRAQQRRPPRPPFMYFYSRPYARGDLGLWREQHVHAISTPAPTRGATRCGSLPSAGRPHFYSRPYARGDAAGAPFLTGRGLFLLTPLREGRRITSRTSCSAFTIFLLTPLREGRPRR